MFIKLKNQAGMTLVEIMVAAGLMGGVALITAKLLGDQSANQVMLRTKAEISKAVSELEVHLNNSERCKQMLAGKTTSAAGTPVGVNGTLDAALLKITTPTGDRTVLSEKNYGLYRIDDNAVILRDSLTYGTSAVDLNINFSVTSKTSFFTNGREVIPKTIPILVQKTGAIITECGPVLGEANDDAKRIMCESLGGAATWNGTNCVLNNKTCPYGTVGVKLTSLGYLECRPLASQINLDDVFDTSTTLNCGPTSQNLSISRVNGKFQLSCGTSTSCMPDGTPCDDSGFCTSTRCSSCCNPPGYTCPTGTRFHGWCGSIPCLTNGACSF
jgi:type II secretory pathway pseudopilin PulG